MEIGLLVSSLIQLVTMLIVVWCLLSWFPNIRWYEQPFRTLDQLVQPLVLPFRKLIPPISGIDLSPMVAILVLQACNSVVRHLLP
ncbi:MAG TPA: YggT family protein [Candidatus Obscuribacterales bacterium]